MPDEKQKTYPDIPISHWWKIRGIFRNRLVANITLKYLQEALGINPSSARGIYRNLQLFGFIDKDGNTTERANHWRVDDQYPQVCRDIIAEVYPVGLLDGINETTDRNYLVDWFVRNTRVGERYASKNAAVFALLREADATKVREAKVIGAGSGKTQHKKLKPAKGVPAVADDGTQPAPVAAFQPPPVVKPEKPLLPENLISPSIHIDIQLHIAPEAPTAQIEEIFAAIERHLYKPRNGE